MYYLNTKEKDSNGRMQVVTIAARPTLGEIEMLWRQKTSFIDPAKNDPHLHISEMPGAVVKNK